MSPNPFEAGTRKAIPAVLVYARNRGRVLMIHRNAQGRPGGGDYHAGKWNGLGGKLDLDESPLEAACREFEEESGIRLGPDSFRPLGALTFPNFKAHRAEDWLVYVFAADLSDEEAARVHSRSDEGDLHWIPASDLLALNLWAGDRHFIPWVAEDRPFLGTIWYSGEKVLRHWIAPLGAARGTDHSG